jgi:hypothetical protein
MNKENQQETPTEAEIAWMAGLIEGDGSVTLSCYIRKEKAKPKIGVEIKLYNTDTGIISKFVNILERLNLAYYITERAQKPLKMEGCNAYGGRDPMLIVSVKRFQAAYMFAKLLRPWMFGDKAHRLDLIIQYLARRIKKINESESNFRQIPLDEGDCKLIVEFYRKFVKRPGHNRHLVEGLLNDYYVEHGKP